MISFKQFLAETPWVNDDIESDKLVNKKELNVDAKQRKKISMTSSGHTIKQKVYPSNDGYTSYTAHDKSNNMHMEVQGKHDGNKFTVETLNAYKGNTITAHDFYHHLITHHNIHLHSDYEQSPGAMHTYKKLQKMSGIHMQSYNGSTGKYSELKPSFQRTYDMDSSTRLAAKKK